MLFRLEPEERGVVGIARTLLMSFVSLLLNVLAGELDRNNNRSAPKSSEFLLGVVNSLTLLDDFGVMSKFDCEGPLLSDSNGKEAIEVSFQCDCWTGSLKASELFPDCCCCCEDKYCLRRAVFFSFPSLLFGLSNSTLPVLTLGLASVSLESLLV